MDKNGEIAHYDIDMAKKWKSRVRNKTLLIAAQNNAISSYYIESKIENTQQNSKCR